MTSMLNPAAGTLPALRCPKCAAEMATYERSGVVVDQCRECRGIYLDRGELERLIDAEAAFGAGAPSRPAAAPAHPASAPMPVPVPQSRGYQAEWRDHDDDWSDRRDDRRDWNDGRGWDDRRRPPKKRSLFGELLEGFGD